MDQKQRDDLLYRHCNGHSGLADMSLQIIDWVKGERELRDKEGQWIYKLGTLAPGGLNENDGFYGQNIGSRAQMRELNMLMRVQIQVCLCYA